jgi:uncharacterized protein YjbJ (UPF0337 family)
MPCGNAWAGFYSGFRRPRCLSKKWRDSNMDKDRIAGSTKQAVGSVKEAAGKVLGDAKLTAEGKSDKIEGKIQNAVGSLKDALKK